MQNASQTKEAKRITSYSDVNIFLHKILSRIVEILNDDFVGMYLYGSLALGDFDPQSSDIDVLVATKGKLSSEKIFALKTMHSELKKSDDKWTKKLEVSYMPIDALWMRDANNVKHPFTSSVSDFDIIEHGKDWIINRWIIREKGVVVAGVAPKTLIAPISQQELKDAVKSIICNSWVKHINGADWMRPHKYQSFTVLTMCRALFAIEYGEIVSKPKAAQWAEKTLDKQWKSLILQSIQSRDDSAITDMKETLRFLRFAVESICSSHI